MTDPWLLFLARHADVLAKPKRKWTRTESEEVWTSFAQDGVARALYKAFFRRVRDRDLAAELLDNCVAQLSLDRTYDPGAAGPAAFRRWVMACAHHHWCAYFDGQRKESQYFGQRIDLPDERPDGWAAARDLEDRVDAATILDHLPDREREIVSRWLDGETSRETAAALGLTEVYVRQLRFRSIRSLRKTLGITIIERFSRLTYDS